MYKSQGLFTRMTLTDMIKQVLNLVVVSLIISVRGQDDLETLRWRGRWCRVYGGWGGEADNCSVSYTHLTLPTKIGV